MKIYFDNVDLNSSSGPNSFAQKLSSEFTRNGHQISDHVDCDIHLSFILSTKPHHQKLVQRLDGIYFNSAQDWKALNEPIRRTFEISSGVIYQSNFNKDLTEAFFGEHEKNTVIHNGSDIEFIKSCPVIEHEIFDKFETVWTCASSWRPHKRLKENVRYFLEHSSTKDCLVVAGNNPDFISESDRVFYTGNLDKNSLIGLYKRSKKFIHLSLMDHCPNVVVDARAAGCEIICASSGGTREIAGPDATVVTDMDWEFKPFKLYEPPDLDFSQKQKNLEWDIPAGIKHSAQKYLDFFNEVLK